MHFNKSILIVISVSLLLTGCSFLSNIVYRPVINQGNYVTQNEIDKLQLGQTKEQVMFIMGSPMLHSIFKGNIWYYVFREQPNHQWPIQKTYTLTFNDKNKLIDIKSKNSEHGRND